MAAFPFRLYPLFEGIETYWPLEAGENPTRSTVGVRLYETRPSPVLSFPEAVYAAPAVYVDPAGDTGSLATLDDMPRQEGLKLFFPVLSDAGIVEAVRERLGAEIPEFLYRALRVYAAALDAEAVPAADKRAFLNAVDDEDWKRVSGMFPEGRKSVLLALTRPEARGTALAGILAGALIPGKVAAIGLLGEATVTIEGKSAEGFIQTLCTSTDSAPRCTGVFAAANGETAMALPGFVPDEVLAAYVGLSLGMRLSQGTPDGGFPLAG